ncbi:MAG: prolyl oligopeptidase family serine peptidase [Chitinophagaceae bacterium]|nr:prolyl oligopeptidase family serine peptidase [Chitinophagaceae bacterium]
MYRISSLLILFFMSTMVSGQTSNPQQYKYVFTVAKDGTGEYQSIQDAIDAMRVYPLSPITLYIKNGVYNEKIELPANNTDVTFIGENVDSTVISWNDYSGKGKHTTFTSYTAKISGNRFRAENITFSNTAGPVGQALALYVDADKAVFRNCKFLGYQDTIFTSGEQSNQLFDHCYIEGTTDFIFGPATAVFQHCRIRAKSNSYITAASTSAGKNYGYVFADCIITADSAVNKLHLGRPWRAHAKTVFIRCTLPAAIVAAGWDNWGNPENEKTVFYAEYRNKGEGAAGKRVSWARQLTEKQMLQYSLATIFINGKAVGKSSNWYADSSARLFNYQAFVPKKFEIISLYTKVPNNKEVPDRETAITRDNVTRISKISQPTLTVYKPQKPNGKAVIICPGGGYSILAFDKEGTRVAEEMNRWGITAFVLKNRLPDDSINIDKSLAPLQDAQQAIRLIRQQAKVYGINPMQIGIMGFSAGGHLASTAATHFNFRADAQNSDTTSARPDFAILIYPVISFDSSITHKGSRNNLVGTQPVKEKELFFSNDTQVTATTPPSFLVHASDDAAVPVENSIRYYQSCVKYKVPVEMHLYPKGGHGFGMNNKTTDDNWLERLRNWLQKL